MRLLVRLFRSAPGILCATLVLSIGAAPLCAQGATGKVQGTVLDPIGEPVANAQVSVLGTGFRVLTDASGYYFFNHVPAGTYNLRAQFIGYQAAEVRGVRVLADQTLSVNFGLSGAVALEAIVVTAAESPIVPRDQVTSKSTVSGAVINELPVDDTRDVINLQPGVVESGSFLGVSIRGGRPSEAVVYLDGVPVRRLRYGAADLDLATNALEEVSVTTGALSAEYGDVQSGVISLVTRSGGPQFQGSLLYETDEVFGDAIRTGFNRFEATLSGPIVSNLTFFVAGTLTGNKSDPERAGMGWENVPTYVLGGYDTTVNIGTATDSQAVAIPHFVQYGGQCDPEANRGVECQGRRLPYTWSTNWRANAKLTYTYGAGSRFSLSGTWDGDQERDWADNMILNPTSYSGWRGRSQVYIVNWVQQVFRSAETELSFDLNLSYQADRESYSILDPAWELEHRDPSLGIELSDMKFLVDFDHYSDDDPADPRTVNRLETQEDWDRLVDNVRSGKGTRVPYEHRNDLLVRQPFRMNPFGMTGFFPTEGYSTGPRLNQEHRGLGRLNVDWQFDRYNRLKFGGEGQVGRLRTANNSLISPGATNIYSETPVRWAAYIQDRLDLGDVVLEVGLRWDYFDSRALFPVTNRSFDHPAYDPDLPIEELTCRGDECDPNEHIWRESEPHTALSPRLRVSFPVTDRTNFRLSYAHQVQSPAFWNVFFNKNEAGRFGGGEVSYGRSILFEFGIRHAFTRDLVVDLAAYNKEKVSDLASRVVPVWDPTLQTETFPQALTNADFGNVRGFEVQVIYRAGNWFNGQAAYSFQTAKGTGSDPYSQWYAAEFNQVTGEIKLPPQATLRTDDDRSHNIAGSLAFNWPDDFERGTWYGGILRNGGLFARVRFFSGLPYTRLHNEGSLAWSFGGTGGWDRDRAVDDQLNGSSLPWQSSIDLRITKGIRLGPTDWTLYADFRNLFNVRNVIGVFTETGSTRNDLYRDKEVGQEITNLSRQAGGARVINIDKGGETLEAVVLSHCAGSELHGLPAWTGQGGAADCVMLQRTEARFGNGDQIYDEDEQRVALFGWYELWAGPQWLQGDPRHIRLGIELSF